MKSILRAFHPFCKVNYPQNLIARFCPISPDLGRRVPSLSARRGFFPDLKKLPPAFVLISRTIVFVILPNLSGKKAGRFR